MVKMTRLVSDFLLPKIRDSFMRQFAAVSALEEVEEEAVSEILAAATTMASISASAALIPSAFGAAGAGMVSQGGAGGLTGGKPQSHIGPGGGQIGQVAGPTGATGPGGSGGWRSKAAETAAAISYSREIRRKVHGLHGEEKVRAIVYLLRLVEFKWINAFYTSKISIIDCCLLKLFHRFTHDLYQCTYILKKMLWHSLFCLRIWIIRKFLSNILCYMQFQYLIEDVIIVI